MLPPISSVGSSPGRSSPGPAAYPGGATPLITPILSQIGVEGADKCVGNVHLARMGHWYCMHDVKVLQYGPEAPCSVADGSNGWQQSGHPPPVPPAQRCPPMMASPPGSRIPQWRQSPERLNGQWWRCSTVHRYHLRLRCFQPSGQQGHGRLEPHRR